MSPHERPDDLVRWLTWLGIADCLCDDGWRSLGRLYGVNMGHGWVRITTHPDCPHHGRQLSPRARARVAREEGASG